MVTQNIYCHADLKTYELSESGMVVSCWPEVCTLQIRSEKILMLDCGILILSYLMPSASEIIYICHFSHGFYDGRLRAVCPGSGTLQDWNTEISVTPSGIL